MQHYQENFSCGVCRRELIADIISTIDFPMSIGTAHQEINAITCREHVVKVGGRIMDKSEEITI